MQPDSASRLWDARRATERAMQFVKGLTWDEYQNDLMLRSAVERQFEIAGEAPAQLRQMDPDTA